MIQYLEENTWFSKAYFCISDADGHILLSNGEAFSPEEKIYTAVQSGRWGLTYSLAIEESTVAGNLPYQQIRNYVLFYGGALVLGILISIAFSLRHYRPIKRIVSSFSNLPQEEKRNKRFYTSTYSYNNEDDNGITFFEHLPDTSSVTPDIYVENKAVSELIKKALNTISEKQQKILLLYYIERYNEKEIANMIGLSQQAVNFNRHSALKILSKNEQLKDLYENDF